jgi:hypothetical protein
METGRIINLEYGGLSKTDLLMRLNSSGILLNEFAKTILSSELFKVAHQTKQITLSVVSIKELGFAEGATMPQIKRKIKEYRLTECPLEIAPYLRLFLKKQREVKIERVNQTPLGSLTIFSKPLVEDDNFPKGFYLRKIEGKLWLRGYRCSLDYVWSPNDKLVFQLLDN